MSGLLTERQEEVLRVKGPELLVKMAMGEYVFAHLRKHRVLTDLNVEDLMTLKPSEQKWRMLNTIKSAAQYEGLILTLLATNQQAIVTDILQENPEKYLNMEEPRKSANKVRDVGTQYDNPGAGEPCNSANKVRDIGTQCDDPRAGGLRFPALGKFYKEELSTPPADETMKYSLGDTITSPKLRSDEGKEMEPAEVPGPFLPKTSGKKKRAPITKGAMKRVKKSLR